MLQDAKVKLPWQQLYFCDFYSFDFYDFLVTGDVLYTDSNIKYDKRGFSKANHDVDKFFIALELVKALDLNKKKQ